MKGCFYLQRRFAYIGHSMAVLLKEKYRINQFCAYVDSRPSFNFLKNQNELLYTKLLLDQDIHNTYKNKRLDITYINWLEKEYGLPNLWPYLENDRFVRYGLLVREYPYDTPPYTHEEIMRIIQVKAEAIINFLKEEKPDFLVISVLTDISTLLIYHIAKKMGVKTFFIQTARVGTKYSVTEDYNTLSYVQKIFEELQGNKSAYQEYQKSAKIFLNQFQNNPQPHSKVDAPKAKPINRKKQFNFLLPKNLLNSIVWGIKIWTDYFSNSHKDDYDVVKPWHYLLDRFKRKIRVLIGFDDLYDEINLNEDFAFFPLQLEPEMSHALFSPFYKDQLWLIKQIACSLPIHFKLYIKEHPAMFGFRTRQFYQQLKKIPNVKLMSPEQPSFDITQNAKIIFTMTSSAGWEGAMFKKPVVTFGNVFFNLLPMVKKCVAIEDLPNLIKQQLENFHYDESALLNLIAAIYKESAELDLVQIWYLEGGGQMEKRKNELIPFIDLIAEKLNLTLHQNKLR